MTRHNDEYAPVLWANRENLLHHLQDDYVGPGMVVSIKPTEYCSVPLYAAPQPLHTTNCCKCGRIIDTREKKDGGDDFGAQLSDGRWTCSIECDDAFVDPQPVSVPDGWQLVPIEPTDAMIDAGRMARMNIVGGYGGPGGWEAMLSAAPQPVINPTRSQVAGTPGLLTETAPVAEIIAKLREDMTASPVDGVTVIDRGQLEVLSAALTPSPQNHVRGETEIDFRIEWIAAARPPVHPKPMTGKAWFKTFERALKHMRSQAADAQFVSITEHVTTVVKVDRTDEFRAALAASEGSTDA